MANRVAILLAIACAALGSTRAMADSTKAVTVDVSAGELIAALHVLAQQTSVEFVYSAAQLKGLHTGGVHGQYTADQAVAKLLQGTKLQVTARQNGALLIALPTSPASEPGNEHGRVRKNRSGADTTGRSAAEQTVPGVAQSAVPALETVTVTGSLIPQARSEMASPVITLTGAQIKDEGFRNVYDAIQSLPTAVGSTENAEGAAFGATFTPGANAVSFFGMDPGFTLTLMNGHPTAQYPLPFNGHSDFTDLANIPLEMVDHIDFLTGASSSIYGSAAVNGVLNIVMKDKFEGVDIGVRGGDYTQHGGGNLQAHILSGFSAGRFDVIFGLEANRQDYMQARAVPQLSTVSNAIGGPQPAPIDVQVAQDTAFVTQPSGTPNFGLTIPGGAASCASLSKLFGGTMVQATAPGYFGYDQNGLLTQPGYYCGSQQTGYGTIINQDRAVDGMLNVKFHITDYAEAYTDLIYDYSDPAWLPNGLPSVNPFTSSGGAPAILGGCGDFYNQCLAQYGVPQYFYENDFWDVNAQRYENVGRVFAPEEFGGFNGWKSHALTRKFDGTVGLKGSIGETGYNYDAYYHYGQVNVHTESPAFTGSWVAGAPMPGQPGYNVLSADPSNFETNIYAYYLGPYLGPVLIDNCNTPPTYPGQPACPPNHANVELANSSAADPGAVSIPGGWNTDLTRFFTPLTTAQFASFVGIQNTYAVGWTGDLNLTFNNPHLLSLPAGDLGNAIAIQHQRQELDAPPDPNAVPLFGSQVVPGASAGTRDDYSVAAEFLVPITSMLKADVSARYDDYLFKSGALDSSETPPVLAGLNRGTGRTGRTTYKIGLEFRPVDTLLLRASYGTAFRAPNLYDLFQGLNASYSGQTDWLACRQQGYSSIVSPGSANYISNCPQSTQHPGGGVAPTLISAGNASLRSMTAQSFTAGVVWSPFDNDLRLSSDFEWLAVSNEVQNGTNLDTLLQTEADCVLGQTQSGQAVNSNSVACQNASTLITRAAPATQTTAPPILQLVTFPYNASIEHEAGIQAQASYRWHTRAVGDFKVDAAYFYELEHTTVLTPGEAPLDGKACLGQPETADVIGHNFNSNLSGNVEWRLGPATTNVHGILEPRYCNAARTGYVSSYTLVNVSEKIELGEHAYVQAVVNNVVNKHPPIDPTDTSFFHYNIGLYNSYGRAYWLEVGARFGGL